ncbi:dodecin domain-containing protein [Herbaspirillum seropedicae]|uniref:Dodecin domain-containing protein n=1 Tax=Herbaspirillum seropedicae (strain SmR1) TaxID=757424 RepID=D8IVF1_HERSS|nr:dodecin family protein [Herbaspirillum seropedicae]ADJ63890.1 conserved hypothetical protein [Herbaspirillum seropedicae SmR1]AKN65879.1 hypothetical protein ACP92_11945 [Herbaspirillum seropedicae]AON54701.1 hypothetical protein Hsc_2416 [Herbaspirillum seropedicae]MDR6394249.1 flavin-binding protein dodecin [Herbaspirillum seropedicae]NQE29029.1 hypothetical protein [Herbaspirillum seropedicae]
MDILKVIEVLAESDSSWEDAAQNAVRKVAKSVTHIKSIYVNEMSACVDGDKIVKYRINAKISFVVNRGS